MNQEERRIEIINELYLTGRIDGLYMGIKSKSKQNPIKAYIRQWLWQKGIRQNMEYMVDEFYEELFHHVAKMDIVKLAEKPATLTASICNIVKRHLMKVDINPIIAFLKKYIPSNFRISEKELNEIMYWIEVEPEEYKELKKVNKTNLLKEMKNTQFNKDYLIRLLWVHQDIDSKKIRSTKISAFERMKFGSNQINRDVLEAYHAEPIPEDSESLFKEQFGIGINDIMESMNEKELKRFKALANRKRTKPLKPMSKAQKEREKRYWDALETNVINTINRIKFNK
ncbi:hypothetical protein [Sphingobacterium sp.]|uniref:hypothetical protein n=1 Tax=Sphingobacterium sp. TaxID=341027 RepID=UPI0028A6F74F|nr:hypothetical protein [Sphingobacterium sp.]